MKGAVRVGDMSAGHAHCYEARLSAGGSKNVKINGRGAHRVGDSWAVHGTCPDHDPHGGTAASGCSSVLVNGKPLCGVGDSISCGDTMAMGSEDVMVGG